MKMMDLLMQVRLNCRFKSYLFTGFFSENTASIFEIKKYVSVEDFIIFSIREKNSGNSGKTVTNADKAHK